MIRAFVAVRLDPVVLRKIRELQSELDESLGAIRWLKPENLHLTLKFLGSVHEDKVAFIVDALRSALAPARRFSVACRGLGVFPDIRRARVLWAGLEGGRFVELTANIEEALEPLGFAREQREFRPHLTIGRWRDNPRQPESLRQEIERRKERDFGASRIDEVIFFQSVLKRDGAVYTPLEVFPLAEKLD